MTKQLAFIGTRTGADGVILAAKLAGYTIAGWFDRFYHGNTDSFLGYPILGSDLDIGDQDRERYVFFLASHYAGHNNLSNPNHNGLALRQDRIKLIQDNNLQVTSLIHPSAYVDPSATLGQGIYLAYGAVVGARCSIGDFSYLCFHTAVGHDTLLEGNNLLLAHCMVGGNVTFKQHAFAGMNSTVAPRSGARLVVGHGAKIAAGAVVYDDVEPNQFVSFEGRRRRKLDADFT